MVSLHEAFEDNRYVTLAGSQLALPLYRISDSILAAPRLAEYPVPQTERF